MPPKEVKSIKIGIMDEDGFHELSTSIEITLESTDITNPEDSGPVILDGCRSFECSFELKDNNRKFFRNIIYGSNNWRKIHGLPMIRKWGKR